MTRINKSIESDPEYLWHYLLKAEILEKLGQYQEAIKCCENIFQPSEYISSEEDKAELQESYNERMESLKNIKAKRVS